MCQSSQVYDDDSYLTEIWTWFGIGASVIIVRSLLRLKTVGIHGFQGDDYLAGVVLLCFACDSACLQVVYRNGANMDFTEDQVHELSPCQVEQVELGSRLEMLAWYTYITLIWSLKGMMLFFFYRITYGLNQQRLVRIFAAVTAITYAAMFLTVTLGCLPYAWNWQVRPLPPTKCTFKLQNIYVGTALNVGTDIMILLVPLPLLWGTTMRFSKKIVLTLLLCSGLFVITAAVIRFAFTIVGLSGITINKWGTRETSAGIIAVNIPILRPLCRWPPCGRNVSATPAPPPALVQAHGPPQQRRRLYSIGSVPWRKRPNPLISSIDMHTSATDSTMYKSIDWGTVKSEGSAPDGTLFANPEPWKDNPDGVVREHDLEAGIPLTEIREETIMEPSSEPLPEPPPPVALKP